MKDTVIEKPLSQEQISSLITQVKEHNIDKISFIANDFGTQMDLKSWQLLWNGLLNSPIRVVFINDNQLDKLSLAHWNVLASFVKTQKIEHLELQNNNLAELPEDSFQGFKQIALLDFPCFIGSNNWHKNLGRWHELIKAHKEMSLGSNSHIFLARPQNRPESRSTEERNQFTNN